MDDLHNLKILKDEERKALECNQDTQKARSQLLEEYKQLKVKLEGLADKTFHDVMIPVGKVGFFPGKLIHTNEIMVLLGDNWFAERSAKQAAEIVGRRLTLIEEQLSVLKKEEENLKSYLSYTDEFQTLKENEDVREIKEEIPDEEHNTTKGKSRKAHKSKHGVTSRPVKSFDNSESNPSSQHEQTQSLSHDELFARLNQLELEEQENEQREHEARMRQILQEDRSSIMKPSDSNDGNRHVTFDDDFRSLRRRAYSLDSDDEEDSNATTSNNNIRFVHSYPGSPQDVGTDFEPEELRHTKESSEWPQLTSPADIYTHFIKGRQRSASLAGVNLDDKPLKSILKKDSRSNSSENLRLKPILKTSPEHRPDTPEYYIEERKTILKTPPDTQGSEQRPGTPENMLTDEPRPILKSHDYDYFDGPARFEENNSEGPSSILKNQSDINNGSRPRTPENYLEDTNAKSILKNSNRHGDTEIKTILKSPESNRSINFRTCPDLDHSRTRDVEPKPILKNVMNEAFSGVIVEHQVDSDMTDRKINTPSKPVSKFKSTRMKR